MERTCNYFTLVLVLVHCVKACLSQETTSIATDQSALLAIKAHITSDPQQFLSNNWSAASSVCDWIGVTCDSRYKRVKALDISNMGLTGTIPPQLGNLSFLVYLDLRNNSFHGNLPHDLARLRRLTLLGFNYNKLSGEVPVWLGSLPELQYLFLGTNYFSGFIPLSISNLSKLETLYLSNNSLQGMLPSDIGNLISLKKLAIEYNQLSGSLPLEIFNISTLETFGLSRNSLSGGLPNHVCRTFQRLEWLDLSDNKFSGQIPTNLSQCSKLQHLGLAQNSFEGFVHKEIANLKMLEYLYLDRNNLGGSIPKEIGNLTMLKILALGKNNFTGAIPQEISNLNNLQVLALQFNGFNGFTPIEIFNHSMIMRIELSFNNLSGHLPETMGHGLPSIEELYLATNHFSGMIPYSISNCSQLKTIEFSGNNFMGNIPESIGDLKLLEYLSVLKNSLTSKSASQELSFLVSLTKCKYLKVLDVTDNPIEGLLPVSIGNLSRFIERIQVRNCSIMGGIPDGIGNLSSLIILDLSKNQLTGSIPGAIQGLEKLQGLFLGCNKLGEGTLDNLCDLQRVSYLYLFSNKFSGSIPNCFGNITTLRYLQLGSNKLNSVPANLWNLKDLLFLNLSSNSLTGSLPLEVGNLKVAIWIDLSKNYLSGNLPTTIEYLQGLAYLSLARNELQGLIPESIGKIFSLETLDLSYNNLSGFIPKSLEMLQYLSLFNVSFNHLRGEIPSRGPFQNFTSESFAFNEALCGAPRFSTSPCPVASSQRILRIPKVYEVLIILLGSAVIGVTASGLVQLKNHMQNKVLTRTNNTLSIQSKERISYFELLRATNGYSEGNLLGKGSSGYVYRGILSDGKVVAVKVFNLQVEGAFEGFEAECQLSCCLRHRNLTKVISSCSNSDFKALILEFMPNGSLDKWLYSHNYFLNIIQRLDVMIDVACALDYLHFGYLVPVVHRDVKPSNVLLDQDMVAHLSDFGIAKLLDKGDSFSCMKALATLGYIAPEYGLKGEVSTKSDVYSYGIMLMEVFTRTNPINALLGETLSLRDRVSNSIPNSFAQVIDENLLNASEEYYNEKLKCLSSIFQVALICSLESPRERWTIVEVLAALKKIRLQLLPYCQCKMNLK